MFRFGACFVFGFRSLTTFCSRAYVGVWFLSLFRHTCFLMRMVNYLRVGPPIDGQRPMCNGSLYLFIGAGVCGALEAINNKEKNVLVDCFDTFTVVPFVNWPYASDFLWQAGRGEKGRFEQNKSFMK